MEALSVKGLCKEYPSFSLKDISFSVEQGAIMGFIGRNGAGKTTTLKSILNLVHPSRGEIRFFGMELEKNELEIKKTNRLRFRRHRLLCKKENQDHNRRYAPLLRCLGRASVPPLYGAV